MMRRALVMLLGVVGLVIDRLTPPPSVRRVTEAEAELDAAIDELREGIVAARLRRTVG